MGVGLWAYFQIYCENVLGSLTSPGDCRGLDNANWYLVMTVRDVDGEGDGC